MNPLRAFGLIAVTLMLRFYALERRSLRYTWAFAGACALGSAYGFLQELGHSARVRPSDLSLQFGVGGQLPTHQAERRQPGYPYTKRV